MKKEALNELEASQKYVFHGTDKPGVELFEPRQAYNLTNDKRESDDLPGVHATSHAEIACFMALMNRDNFPEGFNCGYDWENNEIHFRADQATLDQIKKSNDLHGYVYVFDRSLFKKRNNFEYISYESVKPIQVIEVGTEDLSANIEIIKI